MSNLYNETVYKYIKYISIGSIPLVLLLIFFKLYSLADWVIDATFFIIATFITMFLAKKHINNIISIILGSLVALILSSALYILVGMVSHK